MSENGSVEAFRANWRQRHETKVYHFRHGVPENQLQFAFQSHWRVFRRLLGETRSGLVLEVGCGRGSMSAFFAQAGFEVHLLDTSQAAIESARANFGADGLNARYVCGDAICLPYRSGTFDVVLSIGLLEHFREIEKPLSEQLRVLVPGGVFLGYVVPERRISVQTFGAPVNAVLWLGHAIRRAATDNDRAVAVAAKAPLYRNRYSSNDYLAILRRLGVQDLGSFGMFPVPLISHSTNFPFSLMAPLLERWLVRLWQLLLGQSSSRARDPWTCPEWWGQAFLVWARKGGYVDAGA